MNEPLVSLIIPFYNMAQLCNPFFKSLLDQTYTNIQLIIVNDGSTDNSEDVILSFKERLEKKGYCFEYYYQDNKGLGGAINTGLKKVRGEYFCWADPDDFFELNAFYVRIQYMLTHPECCILSCDAYYRDGENPDIITGNLSTHYPHISEVNQFYYLLDYESPFCCGSHMIKTEAFAAVVPDFDIFEAKRGQNWQLLMPMYYSYKRDFLPIPVYNTVDHKESMSHSDSGYTQKLLRTEENELIQVETLKRMIMPERDRLKYIAYSHAFHTKLKMYNARSFGKKREFYTYYNEIKYSDILSIKDWIRILRFRCLGK